MSLSSKNQVNPLPGQVVAWGKVDPFSFRFMAIKSPNTGQEQAMMLFEMETLPGEKAVYRTNSTAFPGKSFALADGHITSAYNLLRKQEQEEGLYCVVAGKGYREVDYVPSVPPNVPEVTAAPVNVNVRQNQYGDSQPATTSSREVD